MELTKSNVREAMKKEIVINQKLIDSRVLHRNTNRYTKIEVFTAMARNNAIRHFLNLDPAKQRPIDLMSPSIPMSEEYKNLMYRISATSYAPRIKTDAEHGLFLNYTHVDYKRKRHFLDEVLPEQQKPTFWVKFWEMFWENGIYVIGLIILGFIIYHSFSTTSSISSGHHSSSTGRNTFGSGGVSAGNANSKSVSDAPQVKDGSQQAGFGNGGKSGHDAPSSGSVSSSSGSGQNTAPVAAAKPVDLVASYFFPDHEDGDFYDMKNGESASLIAGETIEVDFKLPTNSGAVYKVNGKEIQGKSAASKATNTWFVFTATEGANVVTVDYKGFTYQYKFQAYSPNVSGISV
jgi:hypothetical protein